MKFKRFVYTFVKDYNVNNNQKEKTITVWTALGRDQTQAVKRIIDEDFYPQSGIRVELKMSAQPLAEAILAGLEPDVSLAVAQDVPIDLALRV